MEALTFDTLMRSQDESSNRSQSIQDRFESFHSKHPEVYHMLRALARQATAKGRKRIGIGMLFEVIRWEWTLSGLPDEDERWKLNNNYRSRYARLLMAEEDDLQDVFEIRQLLS
jgi:hypothetical protein